MVTTMARMERVESTACHYLYAEHRHLSAWFAWPLDWLGPSANIASWTEHGNKQIHNAISHLVMTSKKNG